VQRSIRAAVVAHFLEGLSVCSRWKFEAITGL
jgi:hypothetical protein